MSNKSYAVNRFDYAVKRAIDYRKSLAEYLAKAKVQRKKMVSLAKQLCKEQTESMSLYFDVDSHEPFLRVTLEDLESFKDDRLVSRLWYLSNLDGVREPKSHDWAMSLNRDYRFDFDGFPFALFNDLSTHVLQQTKSSGFILIALSPNLSDNAMQYRIVSILNLTRLLLSKTKSIINPDINYLGIFGHFNTL